MDPTRESLTYLVWGVDIKTKLMVQGEQEDPEGPPPSCPHVAEKQGPCSVLGPQVRGLREEELFVWVSMGPLVEPPKSYVQVLTPRIWPYLEIGALQV